LEFLASLPRVRELLATDVEAAYNGDPAALSKDEVIVAYPFVEAIAAQRLAHELYLHGIALIPRIDDEWAHARSGMDLHPGAHIGTSLLRRPLHRHRGGRNRRHRQSCEDVPGRGPGGALLAAGQQLRGKKRHPTVEDDVTIYAGATIVGGDTVVGAGSTIGANAFLTHSVPPRSLVLADDVKVKVLSKETQQSPTPNWEI